jgi:hypothetical protein
MDINHIGHTTIHTPNRDIHLKNVLYVPRAQKNLISIQCLASDNYAFLEFHPNFFVIKDQATRNTILKGRCHKGLYPLPVSLAKQAFGAAKLSFARWHSRLGHPFIPIVRQIIRSNDLPCLEESNNESVCNACQQAKSHQLPYPKSTSVSTVPLELFSQMCGVLRLNQLGANNIM